MIAVNVAQLLRAQVGTFRVFEFSEVVPELAAELNLTSPVAGTGKLTRTPRGIVAEADYRTTVEQECGRCLEPVRTEIASTVGEEFLATTNVLTGGPSSVVAGVDDLTISPHHELDLTDIIRQDVLLQQPLQPLCRADCAGLCSGCGIDLNAAPAGHAHDDAADSDDAEPPLGRLGELLKQKLSPESPARN
jgi:uncharacterized protein